MHKVLIVSVLFLYSCSTPVEPNKEDFTTVFEESEGTRSASYAEGIAWWNQLDKDFASVSIHKYGMTDAGYPLHVVILAKDRMSIRGVKNSKRTTILINNAIHPGEPDGVDASMMLFRDILFDDDKADLLNDAVLVCIPYYNIGGALNRNSHSRANQEGPEEYGFRGNAQNLDLNRDFVKCDSKNALTFSSLLQDLDPDIYVETHVSNGADYQYTMTYLSTQPEKLGYEMGSLLRNEMIPDLENSMKEKGDEMAPYINHFGGPLDSTYFTFYDSPRYSTGLTTLHQIFGFITETHMLKPFDQRVSSTYNFLWSTVHMAAEMNSKIKESREADKETISKTATFPIDWKVDSSKSIDFMFKGYEYVYETSTVTGGQRFRYDRSRPVSKSMHYYSAMLPAMNRHLPNAYVIKQGYGAVVDRLKNNGVEMTALANDTVIKVVQYRILNLETATQPFEKHYFHSDVSFERDTVELQFLKGDFLILCNTSKNRFLIETLEPDAPDSYFNWNFFDAILQQKEWYSSYVFEDKAAEYLESDTALKREFNIMKTQTPGFSENPQWQLYWVYQHSPHYEKEHMILPVFRIED